MECNRCREITFCRFAKAQIALALCGWIWAFAYVLLYAAFLLIFKQLNIKQMEIELRTRSLIAELTIKSGNAKIEEDLAVLNKGVATIPDADIEKFITIAREMNNFNGKSDVEFVKMVYESFLSDYERSQFLEDVSQGCV